MCEPQHKRVQMCTFVFVLQKCLVFFQTDQCWNSISVHASGVQNTKDFTFTERKEYIHSWRNQRNYMLDGWTCFSGSGLRLNPQYEDNVRPFDTKQDLSPNSQANPLDWWKQYVLVLEVRTSNSLNSCSHCYCEWCDQLFSNIYRPGASCINLAAMFRLCLKN